VENCGKIMGKLWENYEKLRESIITLNLIKNGRRL
jgi:hypothetical protein